MKRLACRSTIAAIATAGLVVVLVPATPSAGGVAYMVPVTFTVNAKSSDTGCFFVTANDPSALITVKYELSASNGTATLSLFSDGFCQSSVGGVSATSGVLHGSLTEPQGISYRISTTPHTKAKAKVEFR